jgi:putative transposase
MPKLKHLQIENCVYFITFCTFKRKKIFLIAEYAGMAMDSILFGKKQGWFLLLAFVVMPDHVHLAIVPRDHDTSWIMRSLKTFTSRTINLSRGKTGKLWQEGYRDFVLDRREAIIQKIYYIELNPVRAGIVEEMVDYPFSSAKIRETLDLEYLGF